MAGQTAQKLFDVFFAIPARLGTICATPTLAVLFRDSVSRVLSQFPSPFPSPSFAPPFTIFSLASPLQTPLVSRNNNAPRVTKIFRFRATGNGYPMSACFPHLSRLLKQRVLVLGSFTSFYYSLCVTESVNYIYIYIPT